MDKRALDLLEAAYKSADPQTIEGRRVLVALLDGQTAMSVGLDPGPLDTPGGREHALVVESLEKSGAAQEITHPAYQVYVGATYFEITSEGETMLRDAGRIP